MSDESTRALRNIVYLSSGVIIGLAIPVVITLNSSKDSSNTQISCTVPNTTIDAINKNELPVSQLFQHCAEGFTRHITSEVEWDVSEEGHTLTIKSKPDPVTDLKKQLSFGIDGN